MHVVPVNGTLGLVYQCQPEGRLLAVVSLDVAGGRVVGVNLQANPDKLQRLRLPDTADTPRWPHSKQPQQEASNSTQ
jgi:hypothetical protein